MNRWGTDWQPLLKERLTAQDDSTRLMTTQNYDPVIIATTFEPLPTRSLVFERHSKLFNDWVGENFARDLLYFFLRFVL